MRRLSKRIKLSPGGTAPRAGPLHLERFVGRSTKQAIAEYGVVLLAILTGTLLRLYWRTPETLWLDESNTVLIASNDLRGIVTALHDDSSPPLFYFLLHFWMNLFGDREAGLRIFSGILGSLLPPLTYITARALVGRTAAVFATFVAALAPINIHYAHEVRMYSLFPVLSLLFIAALLAALDKHAGLSKRRWALVVLAGLPLLWIHTFGRFIVAAGPLVWILGGPRNRQVALRLGATLGALVLVDLSWLPVIAHQAARGSADWIAAFYHGARSPFESLLVFGAGYDYPAYLTILGGPSGVAWLSVIWLCASMVLACWFALRNMDTRRVALSLIAVIVTTLGLQLLFSVTFKPIYLVGRYDVGAYSAFSLLLGAGAEGAMRSLRTKRRAAVITIGIILAVYVLLVIASLRLQFRPRRPARLEEKAAVLVNQHYHHDDVVVATGLSRASFEYYFRRAGGDTRAIRSYPRELATHMGWIDAREMLRSGSVLETEADGLVDLARASSGRVFLIEDNSVADVHSINSPLVLRLNAASTTKTSLMNFTLGANKIPFYTLTKYELRPR